MSNDPTKSVEISDNYVDLQSKSAALVADTSTTLATILGEAVDTAARGAIINPVGSTVHYEIDGTDATTADGVLMTGGQVIPGDATRLGNVRLIGASGETPLVSVIVFGDDGNNG